MQGFSRTARRHLAGIGAIGLACVGCGGATAPRGAVVVQNRISVVVSPDPGELPFDPADARLVEGSAQLAALAGHPIVFEFDVALLPEWRSAFLETLIASVESVARDLSDLKRDEPAVFAHGAPLLGRVVSRYDAAVDSRKEGTFDPGTRAVTLLGPAAFWGVERGDVRVPLESEYGRWANARWGSTPAGSVPATELAAYFDFLTDGGARTGRSTRRGPDGVPRTPDAGAVLGVVAMAAKVDGASSLGRGVRAWLLRQAGAFDEAYVHEESLVRAQPPESSWRRAERAWIDWLHEHLPTMTDDERGAFAATLFARARGADGVARVPPLAFPGIDRFLFGLDAADAWARAGHPKRDQLAQGERALLDATLCPVDVDADGTVVDDGRCDYGWYADALDDAAATRRLADALRARHDDALVRAAFFAVGAMPREGDSLSRQLSLLDAMGGDDAAWDAGFRVVADRYAEGGDASRWVDLARRLWPDHPTRRGALLYALVQVDRYGDNDKVGWAHFPGTFGAAPTAFDLGGLLDRGERGWSLASIAWPALSRGWSRAAVLLPRLDAYLARTDLQRYDPHDPSHTLGAIARRLCEDGDVADMARLSSYFHGRIATHPGESYAEPFDDHGCSPRARPRSAAPLQVPSGPFQVRRP